MLLLLTAPDQVCTLEGVETVTGLSTLCQISNCDSREKKAVRSKKRGAEAQLRTPSLGTQADKVKSSIPHLLGLESLTNALSSKSNQSNVSVE